MSSYYTPTNFLPQRTFFVVEVFTMCAARETLRLTGP